MVSLKGGIGLKCQTSKPFDRYCDERIECAKTARRYDVAKKWEERKATYLTKKNTTKYYKPSY